MIANQPSPHSGSVGLSDAHLSRSAMRHRTAKATARPTSKAPEPGTVQTGVSHLANPWSIGPASDDKAPNDKDATDGASDKKAGDDKASDDKAAEESQSAAEGDPFDPQAFNDRYLKGPAE
jgi:hypothetical protein